MNKKMSPAATEANEARRENLKAQLANQLLAMRGSLVAAISGTGRPINQWMREQGFWASDNVGEKIALMHSELSEALEADRKDLPSDKVPGYSGLEEELADTVIRIFDFAEQNDLRLGDAIIDKMLVNFARPVGHGKKY